MTRRDLDDMRLTAKSAMTLDTIIMRDQRILNKYPDRVELAAEIEVLKQKRDDYRKETLVKFLELAKSKPLNEAEFALGVMYYAKGWAVSNIIEESGYSERWIYNTLVSVRDKLGVPREKYVRRKNKTKPHHIYDK